MIREDIKVGKKVRINKNDRGYLSGYSCSSTCIKTNCFAHIKAKEEILIIEKVGLGTVTFNKDHCCGGKFGIDQLEKIFELLPYKWKKL